MRIHAMKLIPSKMERTSQYFSFKTNRRSIWSLVLKIRFIKEAHLDLRPKSLRSLLVKHEGIPKIWRDPFMLKGEVPSAAHKLQCLNRRISRLERAHRTSLELKFDGGFIFKVYFLIAQLFPIQNPRFYSFWELLQQDRDFSEIWG